MPSLFRVDAPNFIQQADLVTHYKDYKKGLCTGLVLEYARYHFVHKLKGTSSNFNKKFKDNIKKPSANFLERVKEYHEHYQIEEEHVIYRNSTELKKLLDDPKFAKAEVLAIMFHEVKGNKSHIIAVKIERSGDNTVYKIFDPNFGESTPYHSKVDLLNALTVLKVEYSDSWGRNIFITAKDLAPVLNEIGIIPKDGSYTKDSKYSYQIIKAIEEKDLTKIHGELGSKAKLDHLVSYFYTDKEKYHDDAYLPDNLMDLAILRLDEADLVKLINNNTQLDLTKSLLSIVPKLFMAGKDTPAVWDALIAKLPPDSPDEYRQCLEMMKNKKYVYGADGKIMMDATPASKFMFEKFAEKENNDINFSLSKDTYIHVDRKYLHITESAKSVINLQLPLNTDGDLYTTDLERFIELHTDSTYMEELNSFD